MHEPVLHLAELNLGRLLAPRGLSAAGDRLRGSGGQHFHDARLWRTHGCAQVAAE